MTALDHKLETWKNKLLDLGKRNRLINYKDAKRSSLRIYTPAIFELWESFVVSENVLEFDYFEDDVKNQIENNKEIVVKRRVVTNQSINEQQKTLRSLRAKSKTAMEEQGVNILYLSFGFLKWSESINSDLYFSAPIVLVPVTLTVESITSPFILSLHEDEIVINPTLVYKLENDFGIQLPEFNEQDNLKSYLNTISRLISNNKWEIIPEVGLSLLSFLKINMYSDLEKRKDIILDNPVVRALNGDASALNVSVKDINNFDHDKNTKPAEIFQVVDADSSQQDAVLFAKKGASFVLQGPPGTGKSQTITNIISECLASGKKVLFVSEKMAALEVVKKRLTSAGLDTFCLTLHSYKANKKDILEQLASAFDMSKNKANISDDAFQKLDSLQEHKKELNQYAESIFTKISPLDKTIYEVYGHIANLQSYDDVIFKFEDVLSVTPQKFNKLLSLLKRLIETVGKTSDEYKQNPWMNAKISMVSFELRHDISANLAKLIPKIQDASDLYNRIENSLHLEHSSTYLGLLQITDLLKTASCSPIVPVSWIIGEDVNPLFLEVDENVEIKEKYSLVQSQLEKLYMDIKSKDETFDSIIHDKLLDLNELNRQISYLEYLIEGDSLFKVWNYEKDWGKVTEVFRFAKGKVGELNNLKDELLNVFDYDIFDIDFKAMQTRFKTEYTSIFKFFNGQYRKDKKTILGLYKNVVKKLSDDSIVKTLTTLRTIDEVKQELDAKSSTLSKYFVEFYRVEKTDFELLAKKSDIFEKINYCLKKLEELRTLAIGISNKEKDLKKNFDFLFDGINTDWSDIHNRLKWAIEFRKKVEVYNISAKFVSQICMDTVNNETCSKYHNKLDACLQYIDQEFTWLLNLFDNQEELMNIRMPALADRLEKCRNGLSQLEKWIDFRNARSNCQNEGLSDFIEKIEMLQVETEFVIPMFKKRFYRLWLDAVLPQFPAVMNFRKSTHENTIQNFANLDSLQLDIAKARIRKKLIDALPSIDRFSVGTDEISVLKRELGKKKKIKPIRKLFREIPNLVLTLKPCLMMSPLSVSLFLESKNYVFDTVIFDEASQVCTENAIGAISRGKQVIIAGDSKQLPPTNFFSANTSDSDSDFDADDEDEDDAYESILDEAGMLPERTLLWHYRSRHEHLIAFSNAKIYKNNLITFPSNVEKVAGIGVEYIFVNNGFYDRGGKKGNVNEAIWVGKLVFEHFNNFPERSLGVITFGEVQQQAIETVVRQLRKDNQQYENFFNEDNPDAFFIKNLENVQGDERDTIIFSIGYAKDATGKMHMNFGPLSKSGGERRLNVAITRAKYNIKLVGSIIPTDIDIERIKSEGPKLLRSYIDFAKNGTSVLLSEITDNDIVEHDSPFESAVYNFLDRKGYRLSTQVGCSGYRIDMAIKHPTLSGIYVLGIECDGAAYHSSRTARERDRLRQAVLEDMGWKIYRIWSTDWIKDPVTEGKKLLEAVERAIDNYVDNECDNLSSDKTSIVHQTIQADFLTITQKVIDNDTKNNPYGFAIYKNTDISSVFRDRDDDRYLSNVVNTIVVNEYPVSFEFICKKVAHLFGNQKATVRVREYIQYVLNKYLRNDVVIKDGFCYPKNFSNITPRIPSNKTEIRQIEFISKEELLVAMLVIASKCIGITRESLFSETKKVYGFNRSGVKIQNTIQEAYELILKSNRGKEVEGKLIVEKEFQGRLT